MVLGEQDQQDPTVTVLGMGREVVMEMEGEEAEAMEVVEATEVEVVKAEEAVLGVLEELGELDQQDPMQTVLGMGREVVMEMGAVAGVEVAAVEEEEDVVEVVEMVLEVLLGVLEVLVVRDGQGLSQTACGMVQGPVKDKGSVEERAEKVTEGRERHRQRPLWQ